MRDARDRARRPRGLPNPRSGPGAAVSDDGKHRYDPFGKRSKLNDLDRL